MRAARHRQRAGARELGIPGKRNEEFEAHILKMAGERGAVLLIAIICVMLLFLISGISFDLIVNHFRLETSQEKILKAYNMAESGINYEVAVVLAAMQKNPGQFPPPGVPGGTQLPSGSPFGVEYGSYAVDRVEFRSASVIITCTGTYQNVRRTLTEQYALPVKGYP
ncbi:Hypothetical protein DEACI_2235 [Acididesulfobacillus acetoxydans]|uniref:Type 4 fimbrial biogenesis protein PilX N-terminal domain-containing protein n=1 Tax=Acididesulfobacillus acetoxydans TaxID=1561005 RepID=A0A8S0W3E0_9FIRM|nr:hypothetical protein [Acididesulfobacillus acetoxydans]CAA7601568.1 Hypothetical protein DEACI_2235 [Acididesulfobacillus acetoxydans]CEJ07055.1 Hypothetical protein DEACI_1511 [Acididesulfobacillus acetoxydans]